MKITSKQTYTTVIRSDGTTETVQRKRTLVVEDTQSDLSIDDLHTAVADALSLRVIGFRSRATKE